MKMIVRKEDRKVMSWMDELQDGIAVPDDCYVTEYDSTMDEFNAQGEIGDVYVTESVASTSKGVQVSISPPQPNNPVAELMKARGKQANGALTWNDMIAVAKELGMEL